jgi:hypothetical protein
VLSAKQIVTICGNLKARRLLESNEYLPSIQMFLGDVALGKDECVFLP